MHSAPAWFTAKRYNLVDSIVDGLNKSPRVHGMKFSRDCIDNDVELVDQVLRVLLLSEVTALLTVTLGVVFAL